ncbi:MAG TPA: ATP-binding cassette domain-containing protein, partial [Gaiellaceae bacterium]|nr:ATP-binding cassette domain-containing protein [Gaiellaceae bacterium]
RVGRELLALTADHHRHEVEDAVLRVRDLSVPGRVEGVSLDVGPGEVVGLAGLVGAGRSDLLGALFGLEPEMTGRIEVDGSPVSPRNPREAMRARMGFVPADRKKLGLVLDMSVLENISIARTSRACRLARPRPAAERAAVDAAVRDFRILTASTADPVSRLSGGNQQKVVLAKWFATEPRVLIFDEPTRGVDVGAKAEIYRLLEAAKARNVAILLSSSETPELQRLCDRILVMYRGRIVARLTPEDADEARIARYSMGHGV